MAFRVEAKPKVKNIMSHCAASCDFLSVLMLLSWFFPYVSLARQVFISHFWGRKGFVCSGTSTAVQELEKLVGSQPLATQENTGMVCCEHLQEKIKAGHVHDCL